MAPRAALLLALLAALPGSPAEPARSGFWGYLSQLTSSKEGAEHGQGGKLGRGSVSLKETAQDGGSYVGNLLEKLAPLTRGLQPRLEPDSGSLREALGTELRSLGVKLSPYVDEVHHTVGKHLEELRYQLRPLTEELLEQVALRARELRRQLLPSREAAAQLPEGADAVRRFAARYADQLAFHTEQAKGAFQPYVDRLVSEIHRSAEELQRNVSPRGQAGPARLTRSLRELCAGLTQSAGDLHRHIQRNLEQLRAKLSPYPGGLRERPAPAEELAREVQRRVEQFRRDTHLRVRAFARGLDQRTEQMRLTLLPGAGLPPGGDPEDLRARLDALWRELARSLGEPR